MKKITFNRCFTYSLGGHTALVIILLCLLFNYSKTCLQLPQNNIELSVVYENDLESNGLVPTIKPNLVVADADIKIASKGVNDKASINKPRPMKTSKKPVINPQKNNNNSVKISENNQKLNSKKLSKNTKISDQNKEIGGGQSEYISNIVAMVSPDYIPDDIDLETTMVVQINLNKDMSVKSVKVKKYSNNEVYNQNIIDKLNSISHFPPLPKEAKFKDYRNLVFTFSPKQR